MMGFFEITKIIFYVTLGLLIVNAISSAWDSEEDEEIAD